MPAPTPAYVSPDKVSNPVAHVTFDRATDLPSAQVGDGLIAIIAQVSTGLPSNPTAPAGWTQLQVPGVDGGIAVRLRVYAHIVAADDDDYLFQAVDQQATTRAMLGKIVGFSGPYVDVSEFVDVSGSNTSTTQVGTFDVTGVTTTVADTCLLYAVGLGDAAVATIAPPGTLTETFPDFASDPGDAATLGCGHKTLGAPGASGTEQFTVTAAADSRAGAVVALKAAPPGRAIVPVTFAPVATGIKGAVGAASLGVAFASTASGDLTGTLTRLVTPRQVSMSFEVFGEPFPDADDSVGIPDSAMHIRRIIRVAPPIVADVHGVVDVDAWTADFPQPTYAEWGHFGIRVGGKKVTFYRDVPTEVVAWQDREPYGSATAELRFPQIPTWNALPSWLEGEPNVDIYQVKPDGTRGTILFEGLVASVEDGSPGLHVQCIGALYQGNYFLRRAIVAEDTVPTDISVILKDLVTPYGRDKRSWRIRPLRMTPAGTVMGIQKLSRGSWQGLLDYVSELLGESWVEDGSTQWTIEKRDYRKPVLKLKDVNTQHWSVHVGEPGVDVRLRLDHSQAPNAVFGEGTDLDNCRWMNAKYPNLRMDDAPVFDGNVITPGEAGNPNMPLFEQEMYDRGWSDFGNLNGTYDLSEEDAVRDFQREAGIAVDGVIGPQTWAAAFEVGSDAGDLLSPFVHTLWALDEVQRHHRDPSGARTTLNPDFDRSTVRHERYENFGARISKKEGKRSAKLEVNRDYPAFWVGRITLTTDPPEGSRLEMKAGQNILVRGHHETDRLMHIASVSANGDGAMPVALEVAEKPLDAPTLGQILRRDRDTFDPHRRKTVHRYNRKSNDIEDRSPVWDCENGAGIIPRHAIYAGLWNVLRIPAGKLGTIVEFSLTADTPTEMAMGIFDRPVDAAFMLQHGAGSEFQGNPLELIGYWETFGDELLNAWGDFESPGGYWPHTKDDEDAVLTGVLKDQSSWYFESTKPPWLWVAMFVGSGPGNVNYVSGRLNPHNDI